MRGMNNVEVGTRQPRLSRVEEEGARRCGENSRRAQRREAKLRPVRLLRWGMSERRVRVARPKPITLRGESTGPGPERRGHGRRVPPSSEHPGALAEGIRRRAKATVPATKGGGEEVRWTCGKACEGLRCKGPLLFRLLRTLGYRT